MFALRNCIATVLAAAGRHPHDALGPRTYSAIGRRSSRAVRRASYLFERLEDRSLLSALGTAGHAPTPVQRSAASIPVAARPFALPGNGSSGRGHFATGRVGHELGKRAALTDVIRNSEGNTTTPSTGSRANFDPAVEMRTVLYRDARDALIIVKLSGPGRIAVSDAGSDGELRNLLVVGSTDQSRLSILAPAWGTAVDQITVRGSLAAFDAPRVTLTGDMSVTGSLGSLALNDVKGPDTASLTIGSGTSTLAFDNVEGLDLNSGGVIQSLNASSWNGDSEADSNISAASMGVIQVAGDLRNTTIQTTASIGRVIVGGSLQYVDMYAGVPEGASPTPDSTSGFANQSIEAVSAASTTECVIAAKTLGDARLGTLRNDSDQVPSVIVADTIGQLAVTDLTGRTYQESNPDLATAGIVGVAKSTPKFTFAVVSDSHVGQTSAKARFQKVSNAIAKNKNHISFVLFSGDLVNAGAEASQFQNWKKVINKAGGPPYDVAVGNHDGNYNTGSVSIYKSQIPKQVYPTGFVPRPLTGAGDLSYTFEKSGVLFIGLDEFATTNGTNDTRYSKYAPGNVGHVSNAMVNAVAKLPTPSSGIAFMFGHVPASLMLQATNTTRAQAQSLFANFRNLGGFDYFSGHLHGYRGKTPVKGVQGLSEYIVATGGNTDARLGYITVTVNPSAGKKGVTVSGFKRV